jgi:hypothetical protein
MQHFEIEDPPAALAWPYAAILLGELLALGHLVATSRGRPPLTYELGWLGFGSMLVMQLYSIRRRVRALRTFGSLRAWLDLHVFLGLQGFVLVAYHSVGISPRASLAAINFALVATVVGTGVVGRYLYRLIPRTPGSHALELAGRLGAGWAVLHRPLAILLLALTTLHILAHFAYAV